MKYPILDNLVKVHDAVASFLEITNANQLVAAKFLEVEEIIFLGAFRLSVYVSKKGLAAIKVYKTIKTAKPESMETVYNLLNNYTICYGTMQELETAYSIKKRDFEPKPDLPTGSVLKPNKMSQYNRPNLISVDDTEDLTDNSPMPFGKYKGTKLENVPASYLIWLYDTFDFNRKDISNEAI